MFPKVRSTFFRSHAHSAGRLARMVVHVMVANEHRGKKTTLALLVVSNVEPVPGAQCAVPGARMVPGARCRVLGAEEQ